jgi:hypothetical protein
MRDEPAILGEPGGPSISVFGRSEYLLYLRYVEHVPRSKANSADKTSQLGRALPCNVLVALLLQTPRAEVRACILVELDSIDLNPVKKRGLPCKAAARPLSLILDCPDRLQQLAPSSRPALFTSVSPYGA